MLLQHDFWIKPKKFCGSISSSATINEGHDPWHTLYKGAISPADEDSCPQLLRSQFITIFGTYLNLNLIS